MLSSQKQLIEQLNTYTNKELEIVGVNLLFIIESLQAEVSQLLLNRRNHGVIIALENVTDKTVSLEKLSLSQLLLDKINLTHAINTLCLTEAIIVKDNFRNCLDELEEQGKLSLPSSINNLALIEYGTKFSKENTPKTVETNNVSPIRLTQIKQRLAQAVQHTSNKQAKIKDKLNGMLVSSQKETSDITKLA